MLGANDQTEVEVLGPGAVAGPKDPIQALVERYWRPVVFTILALLVGSYGYGVFRDTYEQTMKSAADLYAQVRHQYERIVELQGEMLGAAKGDAKRMDEIKKELSESQSQLGQSLNAIALTREPYTMLGRYYSALAKAASGDLSELTVLQAELANEESGNSSVRQILHDATTLALGRAMLNDEKSYAQGRTLLLKVVNGGGPAAVPAAATLALVLKDRELCSEALLAVEDLERRSPEQGDLLNPHVERLKSCAGK